MSLGQDVGLILLFTDYAIPWLKFCISDNELQISKKQHQIPNSPSECFLGLKQWFSLNLWVTTSLRVSDPVTGAACQIWRMSDIYITIHNGQITVMK